MVNFGQAAVGLILVLIVIGGLLYIFYSRTNAVTKTGYGSLIMLALVSLMIPLFWITEGNNQAQAQQQQFQYAVEQGQQVYAQNCVDQCYAIKDNHIVMDTASYNGYTIAQLNGSAISDDELTRIIAAGVYNPQAVHQPANANAVPKSQDYGGALLPNDIIYLRSFIRSADPAYLKQHGYTGIKNGFDSLPDYLQANNPAQYQAAVTLANAGQFGLATGDASGKPVTITIEDPGKNGAACNSKTACFTPINLKVKVGTRITWVNNSSTPHTVTAITGTNTATPQAAPQIFDSAKGSVANTIPAGGKFTYTVTKAAYDFNPSHAVLYYCRIHPDMLAQLTIVQ